MQLDDPEVLDALAFCVEHMIVKHGYSSIVSRSNDEPPYAGARVSLEDLAALLARRGQGER